MQISHQVLSDIGRRRRGNEDSFLVDAALRLFVVADGMGGHAAGEVASRLAVEAIYESMQAAEDAPADHGRRLEKALLHANQRVIEATREEKKYRGMATTVVAALVDGDVLHLAHAGDSRAYLWRKQSLSRLTRDHSWVSDRVDNGEITAEEALKHPLRMMVTRAVGGRAQLQVELSQQPLEASDVLLLCSDGLTGMVQDAEIARILGERTGDLEAAVRELVAEANARGGDDNITVLLLECLEERASGNSA